MNSFPNSAKKKPKPTEILGKNDFLKEKGNDFSGKYLPLKQVTFALLLKMIT